MIDRIGWWKAASRSPLANGSTSFNKRHFPQEACGAVRVVNAGELLDPITLEI
jgi:hypothetical protein